ncbi:hypothetical protein ACHAWF_006654 [Thalassiosira exigua]
MWNLRYNSSGTFPHDTIEGLSKYISKSLGSLLDNRERKLAKKAKEVIDNLNHTSHVARNCNREHDFPRSASRTSFFQNTSLESAPKIASNTDSLNYIFRWRIWFHSNNPMDEVQTACPFISQVIDLVQKVFQREKG